MWIWWERLMQDFSVVHSVILRPLPVLEPQRVVIMWNAYPRAT
jgi:hypothetical protein